MNRSQDSNLQRCDHRIDSASQVPSCVIGARLQSVT